MEWEKGWGREGKGQKLVFKVMQGEQEGQEKRGWERCMRKMPGGGPPAHEEEKETHLT